MAKQHKKTASELASFGRHGDDSLLHVSKEELKGLASLAPGGKLPHNPKTGLPEAFFFLPFLAAAAAPAAAATTAAAAAPALIGTGAALGGAAAGLGAAGAGAAGAAGLGALGAAALPTAAETAGALGATGLAAGAPAALAAAPEVAGGVGAAGGIGALNAAVDPTITGSIGAAGAASGPSIMTGAAGGVTTPGIAASGAANPLVGAGGMGSAPSAIAPAASPAAAGPVAGPLSPASSASTGALSSPAAGVTAPMGTGAATPLTSGTPMASAAGAGKGGIGGLLGNLGNMDLMKLAPLALMMPRGGGGGGDDDKHKGKKLSNDYNGPDAQFPDSSYRGGIDPEFNYFPRFNNGGMIQKYAQGGIVGLGAPSVMNQSPAMMQGQAMPQGGMMNSMPTGAMPAGGGGIAQLMQPPAMDVPQAPPAQLDSPYAEPSGQPKGNGKGASKPGGESDQELIAATVEALQGRSPNPQAVISAFIQTFGQNALQDLAARIRQTSSPARGPAGDGQSDGVPGLIDGNQPAALSSGEYVVPSDVVSGLGNGSTDAGAQQLDSMVGRTRMARGGMVGQPPAINPRHMMPS
jgi:hypothetical protein